MPVWVKQPFSVQTPVAEGVGHTLQTWAGVFVKQGLPSGLAGGQNLWEVAKDHYPRAGSLPRSMESKGISRAKGSMWNAACRWEGRSLSSRDHRAGVRPRGRVLFGLGCQTQQTLASLPLSRVSEQRITCSFFSRDPKVSLWAKAWSASSSVLAHGGAVVGGAQEKILQLLSISSPTQVRLLDVKAGLRQVKMRAQCQMWRWNTAGSLEGNKTNSAEVTRQQGLHLHLSFLPTSSFLPFFLSASPSPLPPSFPSFFFPSFFSVP